MEVGALLLTLPLPRRMNRACSSTELTIARMYYDMSTHDLQSEVVQSSELNVVKLQIGSAAQVSYSPTPVPEGLSNLPSLEVGLRSTEPRSDRGRQVQESEGGRGVQRNRDPPHPSHAVSPIFFARCSSAD